MGTTVGTQDAYASDTPLTLVFGGSARVKIISAMLSERDRDLNVSDIARMADVARSTVYDHLDELQEMGIIVHTRENAGAPMYQINTDSEIVERVIEIEGLALEQAIEEGV